jgi:hypothetical protein
MPVAYVTSYVIPGVGLAGGLLIGIGALIISSTVFISFFCAEKRNMLMSLWGMQKRRLGRTGVLVSRIGFGGIPIIALSKREAESVVTYAFEQGITYFDTARAYGDSEEKIGAALKGVRGGS